MPPPPNPILDYATPKPPISAARVFAGLLCIPAAAFGVYCTVTTVVNVVLLFDRGGGDNVLIAIVSLVLAIASFYASFQLRCYATATPH